MDDAPLQHREERIPEGHAQDYEPATKTPLFVVALQTINTEGQIIWGRYSAMLAGNAFFAALIGATLTREHIDLRQATVVVIASIGGACLCRLWFLSARRGWAIQKLWQEYAEGFRWDKGQNPHIFIRERKAALPGPRIEILARRVIQLFGAAYCIFFLAGIYALVLAWQIEPTLTRKPNQTVQRTGASRFAQETNRTSSAAGSRR